MTSIESFALCYKSALSDIMVCVPKKTYYHYLGTQIIEMCLAYSNDGWGFFRSGDPVNALASFTYGTGWLDAGLALGVIKIRSDSKLSGHRNTISHLNENVYEAKLQEHLEEKAERYCRMLKSACQALDYAPDKESPMILAANEIYNKGKENLHEGMPVLAQGMYVNALAKFSYGYGWLDVGVRAGLFSIRKNRGLFTI